MHCDRELRQIARTHVLKENIFICCRREDSSAYAGWLTAELGSQFGKERGLPRPRLQRGVDFRDLVGEAIDSCAVLLAVIGPKWLRLQDASGRRRIDLPDDMVALEIAAALRRDIRVIPVLVAGARMPCEADLPEQLAGFAYRTAIELSDAGWERQVSGLVDDLKEVFESTAGTDARAALRVVRSAATVPRQNQPGREGSVDCSREPCPLTVDEGEKRDKPGLHDEKEAAGDGATSGDPVGHLDGELVDLEKAFRKRHPTTIVDEGREIIHATHTHLSVSQDGKHLVAIAASDDIRGETRPAV
jgi:hypothetical protein